jgi:DNA-binding NarL/FixJ family response regulator
MVDTPDSPSIETRNQISQKRADDRRMPHIATALIDERLLSRDALVTALRSMASDLDITTFDTCDKCLRSQVTYDIVLYHSHIAMLYNKNVDDFRVSIPRLTAIAPVIVISAFDSSETIVNAIESGAHGFISSATTSTILLAEIVRLVNAGGTFVPATSLSLRRQERKSGTGQSAVNELFSPRQLAVLECLKQGKANKIIAYELDMAENTVKVHVRNIMKKMKVSNRTEVAYRAFYMTNDPETERGASRTLTDAGYMKESAVEEPMREHRARVAHLTG